MTVKELIEELQKHDPDSTVATKDWMDGCFTTPTHVYVRYGKVDKANGDVLWVGPQESYGDNTDKITVVE